MPAPSLPKSVEQLRKLVDSLTPPMAFRKMRGIANALEMQVEDGSYHPRAVTRLCEALLATAELHNIPEKEAGRLEELACGVVHLVEKG